MVHRVRARGCCVATAIELPHLTPGVARLAAHRYKLRCLGHCVFNDIKTAILEKAIQATKGKRQAPNLILDNFKSSESDDRKEYDIEVSRGIFAQAFQQLQRVNPEAFRNTSTGDRVFRVNFKGEAGIDAGGVYREGLQRIMENLFSHRITLLIPCPNAENKLASNLGSYIPNPKVRGPGRQGSVLPGADPCCAVRGVRWCGAALRVACVSCVGNRA